MRTEGSYARQARCRCAAGSDRRCPSEAVEPGVVRTCDDLDPRSGGSVAGHDSVRQIYLRSFQDSDGTDVSDYTDRSAAFGMPCGAVVPAGDRCRGLIAIHRERDGPLPGAACGRVVTV